MFGAVVVVDVGDDLDLVGDVVVVFDLSDLTCFHTLQKKTYRPCVCRPRLYFQPRRRRRRCVPQRYCFRTRLRGQQTEAAVAPRVRGPLQLHSLAEVNYGFCLGKSIAS